MYSNKVKSGILLSALLFILIGCSPKSTTTDAELLRDASRTWIPFTGHESIVFYNDNDTIIFTGSGKESYFENFRYMSDQSGFFTFQEDFYADLERQELYFNSPSLDYFFHYALEKGKGESGNWDILKVSIANEQNYSNDMKIVVYESDDYDKGEYYSFKAEITLNGNDYRNVYYNAQEQRPFEVYYTKERGIIAFKVSATELWTVDPDNLSH